MSKKLNNTDTVNLPATEPKQMSNFWQRALTGAVFIIVLIGSIVIDKFTFGGLFLILTLLGVWEFYRLTRIDRIAPLQIYGTFVSGVLFIICFIYAFEVQNASFKILLVMIPLSFFVFIIELYRKRSKYPFRNIAFTLLGVIYVALPFSLLNYIVAPELGSNIYHPNILLGYFFILWANDTGAYLVGRAFGKRKLFERISPKKSWEGSIGGGVLSLIIAGIISKYYTDLELKDWIIIATIIVIIGSLGDLVESLFKRSINIKDSGKILPGHGGILDRFDALLLSAPFVFAYIILIQSK